MVVLSGSPKEAQRLSIAQPSADALRIMSGKRSVVGKRRFVRSARVIMRLLALTSVFVRALVVNGRVSRTSFAWGAVDRSVGIGVTNDGVRRSADFGESVVDAGRVFKRNT